MRKIDIQEFYENAPKARAAFQKDVYPKAEDVSTLDELKEAFSTILLPAVMQAARANGCVCDDVEEHFWDTFELRKETANGNIKRFFEEVVQGEEFQKGFLNLARSYAMRKKCHTTTRDYICYCDEQEGCPFGDHEVMLRYESQSGIPYCARCTRDLPEWVVEKLKASEQE